MSSSSTTPTPLIPSIDLSRDSHEQQAAAIRSALSTVGFFIVEGAGIDEELIRDIFRHGKTFFSLPMEIKERYLAGSSGSGYTKLLAQALGEGKRDHKETFSYGKHAATIGQPTPPPYDTDPRALESMKRFYTACHQVSLRLLELFALALDLPPEHFRQSHSWGLNTAFSQIHYPALSPEDQRALSEIDIRAGEHKDWGTLTMLFQEPSGSSGLQVYLPSSPALSSQPVSSQTTYKPQLTGYKSDLPGWEWHDAPIPSRPGSFLVNVGLAMELWSSGVYKATMHRVIFPIDVAATTDVDTRQTSRVRVGAESRAETNGVQSAGLGGRHSLAFFVQPDDDVKLQRVLPGGIIDTSSQSITSGELFNLKLRESMDRFKPPKETCQAVETI